MPFLYTRLPESKGSCAEYLISCTGKASSVTYHDHNFLTREFERSLGVITSTGSHVQYQHDPQLFFHTQARTCAHAGSWTKNNLSQTGSGLCAMNGGGSGEHCNGDTAWCKKYLRRKNHRVWLQGASSVAAAGAGRSARRLFSQQRASHLDGWFKI